nr:EcsC family protein [uncultured Bacillus sp.]
MSLTARERKVLQEIQDWESSLNRYEVNDFQLIYDKYIERSFQQLSEKARQSFSEVLDNGLFHLHALIQGSQMQMDAKEKIILNGRIFDEAITEIEDMKQLSIDQLQYIANQQIVRHRLYSLTQGGMTGTGGAILLGSDIPFMAVINLRIVQLIASTYGVEVNTPYEMMTALKVFNASILPNRLKGQGWNDLKNDLRNSQERYFYEGSEELVNLAWIEQLLKQGLKGLAIVLLRKKMIQGVPFISMAVGAGMNYQLTRKVTEFSHKYYQLRYLSEKEAK